MEIDFTTRPPSSGATGSRLNRLINAIHAAAAAKAPLRVAKYTSPVPAASAAPVSGPARAMVASAPPAGEVILGHGGGTEQRDEVDTPGFHAVMLHAPQVAALVDDEHADDDDRELPGEQERIRREGSQSQQQLAGLDDDEAAFELARRPGRPCPGRPLSRPRIMTTPSGPATPPPCQPAAQATGPSPGHFPARTRHRPNASPPSGSAASSPTAASIGHFGVTDQVSQISVDGWLRRLARAGRSGRGCRPRACRGGGRRGP